jgi:carnitine-CoA ligase
VIERTLVSAIYDRVESNPSSTVIGFLGRRSLSGQLLLDESWKVAHSLRELGAKPGDRVVLACGNREEFVFTFFGAALAGVIFVPINVALRGPILSQILNDAEPSIVIVEDRFHETVTDALKGSERAVPIVVIGDSSKFGGSVVDFATLTGSMPHTESNLRRPSERELAIIMYTSGTTGPSKGVMIPHGMPFGWVDARKWTLNIGPDDIFFNPLALFHAGTIFNSVLAPMATGGQGIFAEHFSASRYWDQVRETKATIIYLLSALTPILWNAPPSPRDRDHHVRIAQVAPIPSYRDAFEARFGFPLTETMGSTDIGTFIGVPFGTRQPLGSCGREATNWECGVVDHNDNLLPPNLVGELVARPRRPWVMNLGYWRKPETTVGAWQNLWFHTGDLVRIDEDGWYFFVDRLKDSIRRFGENVSSFEVESVIATHPSVAEVAVFAVPSELSEDEIMAALVLKPGCSLDFGDLIAFSVANLPKYAVPRYLEIVSEFPKTETHRVKKADLRARGVTDKTFDRNASSVNPA